MPKGKVFLKKIASFSASVRVHNVAVLVVAQLLSSIFIFSPQSDVSEVLLDSFLLIIVFSSICVISAGYLINDFYDEKLDLVNKPYKAKIVSYVSLKSKLQSYFLLNFLGVVLSLIISWKASVFFALYSFLIWFYSHKLKRIPLLKEFFSASLSIAPFFVLLLYYKNVSLIIVFHGGFLFAAFVIKELLKDLQNFKGAIVHEYPSASVLYGNKVVKYLILVLLLLMVLLIYLMVSIEELGAMKYYFFIVVATLPFFVYLLFVAKKKLDFLRLSSIVKIGLVLGVFSIALIDTSVLIHRILDKIPL